MPRCNLTLKQKVQIIDLSSHMSTDELSRKFRVHPSTVTRTLRKKDRIQEHAKRINNNFKTVQTNSRCEEHDTKILEFMRLKQQSAEPISIKEICDKAVELARELNKDIKSKRGWWRRFKVRCNIVKTKLAPKRTTDGSKPVKAKMIDKSDRVDIYTLKIKKPDTRAKAHHKPKAIHQKSASSLK